MSKNFNRQELKKVVTSKEYRCKMMYDDPYWIEYSTQYPNHSRGFKNTSKGLFTYQMRMYRTWKHTRKTQYK